MMAIQSKVGRLRKLEKQQKSLTAGHGEINPVSTTFSMLRKRCLCHLIVLRYLERMIEIQPYVVNFR